MCSWYEQLVRRTLPCSPVLGSAVSNPNNALNSRCWCRPICQRDLRLMVPITIQSSNTVCVGPKVVCCHRLASWDRGSHMCPARQHGFYFAHPDELVQVNLNLRCRAGLLPLGGDTMPAAACQVCCNNSPKPEAVASSFGVAIPAIICLGQDSHCNDLMQDFKWSVAIQAMYDLKLLKPACVFGGNSQEQEHAACASNVMGNYLPNINCDIDCHQFGMGHAWTQDQCKLEHILTCCSPATSAHNTQQRLEASHQRIVECTG